MLFGGEKLLITSIFTGSEGMPMLSMMSFGLKNIQRFYKTFSVECETGRAQSFYYRMKAMVVGGVSNDMDENVIYVADYS